MKLNDISFWQIIVLYMALQANVIYFGVAILREIEKLRKEKT